MTGSTEAGRALADPQAVPLAIAYYRALAAQGQVVYRASPYSHGQGPVAFNFDWSFDYYPLRLRAAGAGDDRLPPAREGAARGLPAGPAGARAGLSWL